MSTDIQLLKETSSPFPVTHQIGYGAYYLSSTAVISQTNGEYNLAKITFANSAGEFIPNQPIFLSPQNLVAKNVELKSGHMKLNIKYIGMTLPTPQQNGQVSLECSFTDINGNEENDYTGPIAQWKVSGPMD